MLWGTAHSSLKQFSSQQGRKVTLKEKAKTQQDQMQAQFQFLGVVCLFVFFLNHILHAVLCSMLNNFLGPIFLFILSTAVQPNTTRETSPSTHTHPNNLPVTGDPASLLLGSKPRTGLSLFL